MMDASQHAIVVRELTKTYRVPVRDGGLAASLRALVRREHRLVHAVRDVSFTIEPGEVVGFLGSNGAGKTTTLKMLSGLVHPTAGSVSVLGLEPKARPKELLRRIALVMGNRQQLAWDLPATDGFALLQAIYGIPDAQHHRARNELVELLDLGDVVAKPMRNLSLGERMRCELVGALLHQPDVLFLDEPTLGLDVTSQRRVREFLAEYNRRHGATILLTSHYMADIQALCERVVVIDDGTLLFDGALDRLVADAAGRRLITFELAESIAHPGATVGVADVVEHDGARLVLGVPREDTAAVVADVLSRYDVADMSIADLPIEQVIERVFASGRPACVS